MGNLRPELGRKKKGIGEMNMGEENIRKETAEQLSDKHKEERQRETHRATLRGIQHTHKAGGIGLEAKGWSCVPGCLLPAL